MIHLSAGQVIIPHLKGKLGACGNVHQAPIVIPNNKTILFNHLISKKSNTKKLHLCKFCGNYHHKFELRVKLKPGHLFQVLLVYRFSLKKISALHAK